MQLAETNTIMPLVHTGAELASTGESLRPLISNQAQVDSVVRVIKRHKRLLVVGSGESFVAAKFFEETLKLEHEIRVIAVQSFEFLRRYSSVLDCDTCVLVLSSSARPSPVMDALKVVIESSATSILLTNNAAGWKSGDKPDLFYSTFVSKRGMPTQSTVATILALLLIAQQLKSNNRRFYSLELLEHIHGFDSEVVEVLAKHRSKIESLYGSSVGYCCIGSGFGSILSESFSNLLACGPEVDANYMEVEEYHHSLRMFLPQEDKVIFITCDSDELDRFTEQTIEELLAKSARVVLLCTYDVSKYAFSQNENFTVLSLVRRRKCSQEVKSLFLLNLIQYISFYMAVCAVEHGHVRASI